MIDRRPSITVDMTHGGCLSPVRHIGNNQRRKSIADRLLCLWQIVQQRCRAGRERLARHASVARSLAIFLLESEPPA